MRKARQDFFSGLFFLAFGIYMYVYSFNIPNPIKIGVGAGFLPRLIGAVFVILSIILIVSTKIKMQKMLDSEDEQDTKNEINKKSVVLSIGALLIYVLLLKLVGFIIMSTLYLFFAFNLLSPKEERNLLLFAIISVVIPVSVYLLFVKGFDLILPSGILG